MDTGKAPTSHTHVSTAISDSTTADRALLTAANVAVQNSLLGITLLGFQSGCGHLGRSSRQIDIVAADTEGARQIASKRDASKQDWRDPRFSVCDALETSETHVLGDVFRSGARHQDFAAIVRKVIE